MRGVGMDRVRGLAAAGVSVVLAQKGIASHASPPTTI
jgi:hypothetical protein